MNEKTEKIVDVVIALKDDRELAVEVVNKLLGQEENITMEVEIKQKDKNEIRVRGQYATTEENKNKALKAAKLIKETGMLRGEAIRKVGLPQCGNSYKILNRILRELGETVEIKPRATRSDKKKRNKNWTKEEIIKVLRYRKQGMKPMDIDERTKYGRQRIARLLWVIENKVEKYYLKTMQEAVKEFNKQ